VDLSIPSIRFNNCTSYDALHFDTIDQNGVAYHVIAAKAGYTLGPAEPDGLARLLSAETPALLNQADTYYDDNIERSVRHESDLAPYKPYCDVVVLGTAHAPGDKPRQQFDIALHVQLPDSPAELPEKPRPLNPMQSVSFAAQQEWLAKVERARQTSSPGQYLISKVLRVTGPRQLKKRSGVIRSVPAATQLASLGLVRPASWNLTSSTAIQTVAVRYEYAQGGSCWVEDGSPVAERVPQKYRLSPDAAAAWNSAGVSPIATDACQTNPVGRGYVPAWYLLAARMESLPAPQIEYRHAGFSADLFERASSGTAQLTPAGFGFVGRAWLPRRSYVGSIDSACEWGAEDVPGLPSDFDFRYWNGAPEDQQCRFLLGHERIKLVNLCSAEDSAATVDARGNTHLRFAVPPERLFLLGADHSGAIATIPLSIDTVVVDTDALTVELTYRTCLVADGVLDEVRLYSAATPEQLIRLSEWELANLPESTPLESSSAL